MKDLVEAGIMALGGFLALAFVLAIVAGSWWLIGALSMWVWSITIGSPPLLGWQCGLILFTCHILFKIVTGLGSH